MDSECGACIGLKKPIHTMNGFFLCRLPSSAKLLDEFVHIGVHFMSVAEVNPEF